MRSLFLFAASFCAVLMLTSFLIRIAPGLGLMDMPGGRKNHERSTPLVGGIGIAAAVLLALAAIAPAYAVPLAAAVTLIVALGICDDLIELKPSIRFLVETGACLLVILAGGIVLRTVGNLGGWGPIGMWHLTVAMTAFAVIGVVNAINMADGIDGHVAGIGLAAFGAYALAAREMGMWDEYRLLVVLCGSTAAFAVFNARFPWNRQARAFLGDAGSMLTGFLLGIFAVQLTAGNGSPTAGLRTLPPIAALWVVVLPLCDCISLMVRRRREGRSMFAADRQHFHHYLLARGCGIGQASLIAFCLNAACAAIGIGGWLLGWPEPLLFGAFVVLFVCYHRHMRHAFSSTAPWSGAVKAIP